MVLYCCIILLSYICKWQIPIRYIKEIQSIGIGNLRVEHHSSVFTPGVGCIPSAGRGALSGNADHALISHCFRQITEGCRKIITVSHSCGEHLIGVVWLPSSGRPQRTSGISAVAHHIVKACLKFCPAAHSRCYAHAV